MAAKRVGYYEAGDVTSAPPLAGAEATLVNAAVVGIDVNGYVKPADFRASAGPVAARGFATHGVRRVDTRGNVLGFEDRLAFTREGRVGNLFGLLPGASYYLYTGGTFQTTKPGATTGDLDQAVGWALTATELIIKIGEPVVHA